MKLFLRPIIIITMSIVIFFDLLHIVLMILPEMIYTISEKMADFAHNLEGKL
jgi:hypothetical protein